MSAVLAVNDGRAGEYTRFSNALIPASCAASMVDRMMKPWSTVHSLEELPLDGVEAVAADVDHTLFDFDPAHAAAIDAVRTTVDARLGAALAQTFDLVLAGSRIPDGEVWDRRNEFNALLKEIAGLQPWADPKRPRKWSRETWMQIANERMRLGLRPEDIRDASRLYWQTLGGSGGIYPDAQAFLRRLAKDDVPLVLMTASDSTLALHGDGFVYDPAYARAMKLDRLGRMDLPALPASVIIGDPHDKPSKEFYDQVDEAAHAAGAANVGRVIAVGDSIRGDVQIPAERGYRAYHLDRK